MFLSGWTRKLGAILCVVWGLLALQSCDVTYLSRQKEKCEKTLGFKWVWLKKNNKQGRCFLMDFREYAHFEDPDLQGSIAAAKAVTGESDPEKVYAKLRQMEVLDFSNYPEVYDLRPFNSLNFLKKIIFSPKGRLKSIHPFTQYLESRRDETPADRDLDRDPKRTPTLDLRKGFTFEVANIEGMENQFVLENCWGGEFDFGDRGVLDLDEYIDEVTGMPAKIDCVGLDAFCRKYLDGK